MNVPVAAEVGNVIDLRNYLSTPTVDVFQVCPSGLVVDETIVFTGTLSIATTLTLSGENGFLGVLDENATSFGFDLSITSTGTFNFFVAAYMGSSTPSISYSFFEPDTTPAYSSASATLSGDMLTASIAYENASLSSLSSLNLSLSLSFDFSSYKNSFQTDVYDKLGDNPMAFDLALKLK